MADIFQFHNHRQPSREGDGAEAVKAYFERYSRNTPIVADLMPSDIVEVSWNTAGNRAVPILRKSTATWRYVARYERSWICSVNY
jgi:hypothetical protein